MRKTMNNLFYCVITILITCIVPSCTSDYSQNLGQKYVYRDEGGRIKEIFSQESDGEQIPATVISFDYNRQFIIAKQKPKIPQDPLYEKEYLYPLRSRHGLLLDNNQERAYRIGSYEFGCF